MLSIRAIEGGSYVVTDSTGDTVRVDADDIRRVANAIGGALDQLADDVAKFQALEEAVRPFGASDPASELASLHAQVKGVFVSTSDGVKQDLDTFGTNLRRGADNWDAADQSSAERSRMLSEQIAASTNGGSLATQEAYHGDRERRGGDLSLGDTLAAAEVEAEALAQQQAEAGVGDLPGTDQGGQPVEAGEAGQ